MPPIGRRGPGRPPGRRRGGRPGQDTTNTTEAGPSAIPAANTFVPGGTIFDIPNPYSPGAGIAIPANPYTPGTSMPTLAVTRQQTSLFGAANTASQPDEQPRPGESPTTFRRRIEARDLSNGMQTRRRARLRAAREAADEGREEEDGEEEEPKRKGMGKQTPVRAALVDRLNECDSRVTRSAVERDEELINCQHCGRGATWPMKCRGGDECTECEARGIECVRGPRKTFDTIRARQLQGAEPWRPDTDQCRQCKSRGSQCWMPGNALPGQCLQCQQDGLPCDVMPLQVRRCKKCLWEHKCVECARNHLRCDGQIPCMVCSRKKIDCAGLKPDGSCPELHMSMYGTGLPPLPPRTCVRPPPGQRGSSNWPPPSGRLGIPPYSQLPGVDPGPFSGPVFGSSTPVAGTAYGSSTPAAGTAYGSSPPFIQVGTSSSDDGQGANPQQSDPPLPQDPNFNPNNIRDSLYNPFDDDKPPCSHCAADIHNRICDQNTPCRECALRNIVDAEDCRTSRPCEFCYMNEMPCDAGAPCQNCMFLGFGADECRPDGPSPQRYWPNAPNAPDPDESDDEPFIHPLGYDEVPEFDYSCAFCVAYGFKRCNPQDRPCLTCIQFKRTALQCRFEERCGRCIELDVPCDGKMPCTLCSNADGLTSMMCLGRGDTTMPGDDGMPLEGNDVEMGVGGDYPVLAGFGNAYPPPDANDPFDLVEPQQPGYVDPASLGIGVPGQSILPQAEVPAVPPLGFFTPPAHVRTDLLPHYRIRSDVLTNGHFNPVPGGHVSWNSWAPQHRCQITLANGQPCHNLPTIDCDGADEHGDEDDGHGHGVCQDCRKRAEEHTAYLMEEVEQNKNLFCCATCSQAQVEMFSRRGFESGETLVDNHCDCDTQMRAWLCYGCRFKVIHTVGNRMISTRQQLTRDGDNAILCSRCGVEPGNKEAAYHLARGLARCSSCWGWINYAK